MRGFARFGVALLLAVGGCSRSSASSAPFTGVGLRPTPTSTTPAVAVTPGADTTRFDGATALDFQSSSEGMGGRSRDSAHLIRNASGAFAFTLECQIWETKESRSGTLPAGVVTDFLRAVAARGQGSLAENCEQGPPGMTDRGTSSLEVDVQVPRGKISLTTGACGQWNENGLALAADDGRGPYNEVHPTINAKYKALLDAMGDSECYKAADKAHQQSPR